MLLMQAQENGVALDEEQLLFIPGGQDNVVDEDVNEQPVQDLALNVDNVFQADDCDAFDSDVDEASTAQTMFMANLSSVDPVYDEASPSYNSNILSEVPDHENYQDVDCEHHKVHEMHDDVQPNYVVDSHTDYANDSNMISYDQYVKDNAVSVVQSNVSYVPNDAYMMIINEMHEPSVLSISANRQHKVVNASLTAELATYKEQVKLYERRAKFELTEREQKIKEQLRIDITNRNIKEEHLKKELHSVKIQITSTINHNKSMVEEVTSLKKDFKQKENKYLEEFLDMKALKEKEIIKTNHVSTIVHNSKDTLEVAGITKKKMNDKMKDPECVKKKVKIAPHDYSKENYLATFTPQKQLTHEQIFWSKDLLKMKAEALKNQTTASRPIKVLTVYPPNTLATLVPRRITPTWLIEGERSFEQTKECYLNEVIPFFKTVKDHFEGIQKALTKETKGMKQIFKELEAEVDQNVVNRKHDEIERKNLLIVNDNLIADCLSKDVFYTATDYVLTVSRFSDMHEAFNAAQKRQSRGNTIHELREKISRLTKKHSDADPIHDLKALDSQNKELHAKVNALHDLNERWRAENEKLSGIKRNYVEPIPPRNRNNRVIHLDYLKHHKKSVATLSEIVEVAKVEKPLDSSLASACLYTKHSQELVIQIVLWYIDSGRSKHMTEDCLRLRNFMKKFIRTVRFEKVRFENDYFGAIMGYGEYVISDSVISREAFLLCLRYEWC
nr:integrase, catalytic region, zinc finger, CCHC-type, peptidase aspartic, catalytic [Tanacetum cinerariifolium]